MKKTVLFAAALAAFSACAGKQDPAKVSLTFQTQLDSGNAAYRRHDFKRATKFYHKAAKSDPKNLSGYYGIYMAETKLGNKEEAAKARAVVAKMAPYMPLTAHPTAGAQGAAAPNAQPNPHVPQAGAAHPALPLDSSSATKEKP